MYRHIPRASAAVAALLCSAALGAAGEATGVYEPTAVAIAADPGCGDARMHEHNVTFTFSMRGGDCVAGVRLVIAGESGDRLIDVVSDGGAVHATVPPGAYLVTATYRGTALAQRFHIGPAERSLGHFSWSPDTPVTER